jgi:hypothetical protein
MHVLSDICAGIDELALKIEYYILCSIRVFEFVRRVCRLFHTRIRAMVHPGPKKQIFDSLPVALSSSISPPVL